MVKRLKSAAIASFVSATLLAAPVAAQDSVAAANRADAQCLAVSAMLMGSDDMENINADVMAGGMLMLGYFMGRIEGRSPNADLTGLLQDVVATDFADEAQVAAITDRCMTEVEGISTRLSNSASALEKME